MGKIVKFKEERTAQVDKRLQDALDKSKRKIIDKKQKSNNKKR